MKTISVLIAVDVEGALAGILQSNVYLIDTNKYAGSGNEGQANLKTVCNNGDVINWRVVPIAPSSDVIIDHFSGTMVTEKYCIPQKVVIPAGEYWSGQLQTQGFIGDVKYNIFLNMHGNVQSFNPYLVIGG